MAEQAATPQDLRKQQAKEALQTALVVTDKYARIAIAGARKGSEWTVEKVGEARSHAPEVTQHLLEGLAKLQGTKALELRAPEDALTFEVLSRELGNLFGAVSTEFKASPPIAVGGATLIALRLLAAIDALTNTIITEALYTKTFIGRASLLAATAPGYVAAVLYTRKLALLPYEEAPPNLAAGARRLPIAFWLMTASSGTVTIKAAAEAAGGLIRRVNQIRFRTLLLGLALLGASQHPAARELFSKIRSRIPPGLSESLDDFVVSLQHWTRALAGKVGPLLESIWQRFEGMLRLPRGSLPRASIMQGMPPNFGAGGALNAEKASAASSTGETEARS